VVYQWDRVPEDANGDLSFYFSVPPDLAVEVMSPGQTLRSCLERCRELVGHGVRVVVLVDPIRSGVHVIRPDSEIGPLRDGETVDMTDVIPDFRLAVTDILARIRPGRRR
jgi:Uma2 family endonuclease